jgi:hypothetical protein
LSAPGRPLRFLAGLAAVWIGVRVAQLVPDDRPIRGMFVEAVAPPVTTAPARVPPRALARVAEYSALARLTPIFHFQPAARPVVVPPRLEPESRAPAAALPAHATEPPSADPRQFAYTIAAVPLAQTASRFAGSAWLIVRGGAATPFAPQLGGSQAGLRLTYAIDAARRLSLAGRVSGALGARQREAAIGLDWRPTALPIHLVAEQRIGIEGVRGGPSLGLVGGIGPTPIVGDIRLDAYAQGGAIARDGIEGFVDGAVRIAQPVATFGPARLELGLGVWGGAQRDAARLDAGPAASLALPIGGRGVRVSLEWRQRLAGRAAPASGPALSIGGDF